MNERQEQIYVNMYEEQKKAQVDTGTKRIKQAAQKKTGLLSILHKPATPSIARVDGHLRLSK
jgi:hypothetical protein